MEPTSTSFLTRVWIQPNASGGSGAPVDPSVRRCAKLPRVDGTIPSFMHAVKNGALVPK